MPEIHSFSESIPDINMQYSVSLPILNLPMQAASRPQPYMRVRRLKRWMNDLPTADCQRTAVAVVEQLERLNNGSYPPQERACLMDNLRPLVQQLINTLSQQVRKSYIPLSPRALERYQLLQDVLAGMATGYKLVVNALAMTISAHREHDDMLLREALYFSSQYIARQLLEAYLVYMPEPKNCWLELHQLFQYAVDTAMATLTVDDPFPDISVPIANTVDLIYKRIVLLALAEPYHLMKNEAREFYYLLSAWASNCELLPSNNIVCEGEFCLDANTEKPPRFVSSEIEWKPENGYVVDISEAQKRLDMQLQRILRANLLELEDNNHTLIQQRRQRDMLLRLADAWQGVLRRNGERYISEARIELATGLNAGHHYISLGKAFSPEVDELRIKSDEIEPTIFAAAYRSALQKDRCHHNRAYETNPWWQRNFSRNGAALYCSVDCPKLHTAVGELVTYCDPDTTPPRWKIGVVRWLHASPENLLDLGIMNIADSAVAVASKALVGCGGGTDYFRSLLVPKQVSLQQQRCLIVPANIYDINSLLAISMKHRIFYVRLTKLMLSTQTFSQFEFDVIEKPPVNNEDVFMF